MTTTARPWTPEPGSVGHHRSMTDPAYRAIMGSLYAFARANPEVEVAAVVMALGDCLGDLSAASGILASSPNLVASLRGLVDELERRRSTVHREVRATLGQFFAGARPPIAN
jgi:hypothetical protein